MLVASVHLEMRPIVKSVSQSLHLSLPLIYPLIMKIMIIFLFLTQTLLALSEGNPGEEEVPHEYWLAIAYANGIEVAENKSVAPSIDNLSQYLTVFARKVSQFLSQRLRTQ